MTADSAVQPVFLVGSERSGTTLLRLMLDHHPQIAFHFESEYLVAPLRGREDWPNVDDYAAMLELDRTFQAWPFTIDRSLSYPQIARSFLEQRRQQAGKPIVGATVHTDFNQLPRIWPEARYIHIVRDGRDVARSAVTMGWAGHPYEGAERWIEAEQAWRRFRDTLQHSQYMDVRYEDLISNATHILTQLCAFIGVPFDEAMFNYAKTSTYSLPDPSLVFQWKGKMSQRDIQILEARIGDMLECLGYELSGYPRITLSDAERRAIHWTSRWRRMKFRMKRYGPLLYLADFAARRLGLERVRRPVIKRMNIIDEANVK